MPLHHGILKALQDEPLEPTSIRIRGFQTAKLRIQF